MQLANLFRQNSASYLNNSPNYIAETPRAPIKDLHILNQ